MPWWAWLASVALGCGHSSAPAKPSPSAPAAAAPADASPAPKPGLEEDLAALADRAVKLYVDWKVALGDAGTDCVAATAKMNAIADANADVIAANQRLLRGSRERIKAFRAELDKRAAELDPAAKAILEAPAMKKCSTDPGFSRAVDRLGGEG